MTAMVEGPLKQMGGDNWEEAGKEFVSENSQLSLSIVYLE